MNKKILITGLVTLIGIAGVVSGAFLLRRSTEIREQAAVPGGRAEVSLLPTSGSFDVGDTFPVSVYFNTDGVAVSGVAVRVTYPFSGSSPEVSASDVEVNPTLLATGDWSCPTNNVTESGGNVNIDIACANISAAGYSTSSDTLLATFNLTINETPSASPFTVRFDPSNSVITQKSNGQDILNLPTSTGSYNIGGFTPSPTSAVLSPTPTLASGTPTPAGTSLTPVPSITQATGPSTLPDSGFSLPTVVGLGIGLLAIFGSLAFAL